jgi:hypothetical protein
MTEAVIKEAREQALSIITGMLLAEFAAHRDNPEAILSGFLFIAANILDPPDAQRIEAEYGPGAAEAFQSALTGKMEQIVKIARNALAMRAEPQT